MICMYLHKVIVVYLNLYDYIYKFTFVSLKIKEKN